MQYYIFLLIALVFTTNASTTAINAKPNNQNADRGISQFFKDLKNDVILPPINNLAQSLAGMGAQIFAGIAEKGIGKRNIDLSEYLIAKTFVDQHPEIFDEQLKSGIERERIIADIKDYLNQKKNEAMEKLNDAIKEQALKIAIYLNNISQNGIGKK